MKKYKMSFRSRLRILKTNKNSLIALRVSKKLPMNESLHYAQSLKEVLGSPVLILPNDFDLETLSIDKLSYYCKFLNKLLKEKTNFNS